MFFRPRPPGIPILKVTISSRQPSKFPKFPLSKTLHFFVYLSILDLYWRCNLYVYLRTAAVVVYMGLLCNSNNNISAKSKMTSLPARNT